MSFVVKVTEAGRDKIAAAVLAGTQITFAEVAVGDDDTEPTGTETELRSEVDRVPVNLVEVDAVLPSRINIEAIIPTTSGGYWIREFGVFDSDGDLIVIGQYPPSYKPDESEGATSARVIRTALVISRTESITLTTDLTTVIGTRDYIDSHINRRDNPHEVTVAQLLPGGLINQALFKASNDDGDTEWRDITAVAVIVDTVEERVELVEDQTVVEFDDLRTTGLAVYVGGARLVYGDDYTVTGPAQITLSRSYPEGTVLIAANNDPYGHVSATTSEQGLVQLATPSHVYKLENPAGNPRVITPALLGSLVASLWTHKLHKLVNPLGPAFAAVFGTGGKVVVAQDCWVGMGLSSSDHQAVKLLAGDEVTIIGLGPPKGSWTIWWDKVDQRLEAYQIAWSAIETGTRPSANHYGPLGGFEIGGKTGSDIDIIAGSCWDTTYRPAARDPRGMVIVAGRFWADIYFHHTQANLVTLASSAFGLTIADGNLNRPAIYGQNDPPVAYGGLTWHIAVEALMAYGKRVPTYDEFYALAMGSANGVVTRPTTTGWISGRRSIWGVEQATGCVPIWGGVPLPNTTPATTAYDAGVGGKLYSSQAAMYPAFGGSADLGGTEGGPGHMEIRTATANFVGIRGVCEHLVLR